MIRRLYAYENTPKLVAFGRRMHEQHRMPFPYDVERCEKLLRGCYMAADRAVWGAFDGKRVCGVLIASVEPFAFMRAEYVTDLVFVAERHGEKLYRAMVQWGEKHGAQAVQLAVSSGFDGADKFYTAQGLKRMGGMYFKMIGGAP